VGSKLVTLRRLARVNRVGLVRLAEFPDDPEDPVAIGDNDPRIPSEFPDETDENGLAVYGPQRELRQFAGTGVLLVIDGVVEEIPPVPNAVLQTNEDGDPYFGVGVAPVTGVCGATALTAGMFVNLYDVAGIKTVRPADVTDNTKPAHGFVRAGATIGQTATVYMVGNQNAMIPLGAFVAADVGKALYLGTAGGVTLTRPTTGYEQALGVVVNVGSTITSSFAPGLGVTL
jgi:hypothetical protein